MPDQPFTAAELLAFTQNPDTETIFREDRKIAISLLINAYQSHASSLVICLFFSHLKLPEDLYLESQETARVIIEEVLAADFFEQEALKGLDQAILAKNIDSPLWFYLARSAHAQTATFKTLLLANFPKDPAFFSEVMEKTGETGFLNTIEVELKKLAPYVKYLPIQDDSHEILTSHDAWLRVGSAYARLWKLKATSKSIPNVLDFLRHKFFDLIPDSQEEWSRTVSEEENAKFQQESDLYEASFEFVE